MTKVPTFEQLNSPSDEELKEMALLEIQRQNRAKWIRLIQEMSQPEEKVSFEQLRLHAVKEVNTFSVQMSSYIKDQRTKNILGTLLDSVQIISQGTPQDRIRGSIAIHEAIHYRLIDTVRYLLAVGVDPNIPSILNNFTALHLALESLDQQILTLILDAKLTTQHLNTAFNSYVQAKHDKHQNLDVNIIKRLLNRGADPNILASKTCVYLSKSQPNVFGTLLRYGYRVGKIKDYDCQLDSIKNYGQPNIDTELVIPFLCAVQEFNLDSNRVLDEIIIEWIQKLPDQIFLYGHNPKIRPFLDPKIISPYIVGVQKNVDLIFVPVLSKIVMQLI